ncbi:MAG: diguanylate cyclase [Syntrophobacteraceae bacterium]|nr:diguanylate cyclase [Syntrophobacteraceae bacterium]
MKFGSHKILVVDDEQQVCEILAEALGLMGHQVGTAGDGIDALEKLQNGNFELVITDIDMPRMDGIELIKHLVQHKSVTDVIAITGHMMRYKYMDVVNAGAADFITKPFSFDELEAKLNRLLRERYLRQELERLVTEDALTGLYNRRFFQKALRKEAIRATRYQHPLFLFFFDIDQFKTYNDLRGHPAGDKLLIEFALLLRSSVREEVDTAFRFGGDEFTALLPHLQCDQVALVAERIRERYNHLNFTPTTLSIGIAQFRQKTDDVDQNSEDMILRADRALYHAKHALGGNCAYFDEESVGQA